MRLKKLYLFITSVFIITFISVNTFSSRVSGQVKPITDVEEKLQDISEIEQEVLENLFSLSQKIEETERQKERISIEIEQLRLDSEQLSKEIEEKQKAYNNQLNTLKKVLVSYQRRGPASFLETVLKSENLSDFVQSLNIIRHISRNTDELLKDLENRKNELIAENEKLKAREEEQEKYLAELQKTIDEMYALKEEQEEILNSLGEAREAYESELERLQNEWDVLKELFSGIVDHFTKIVERGELSINDLNLRIGFSGISGTIYDSTLNSVLEKQTDMPKMVFTFKPEGIWIDVPDYRLSLRGAFIIENETALKFEVEEGSFCEMPLTEASLAELFKNGPIVINFEDIVGNMRVESVEVSNGCLKFMLKPKLG